MFRTRWELGKLLWWEGDPLLGKGRETELQAADPKHLEWLGSGRTGTGWAGKVSLGTMGSMHSTTCQSQSREYPSSHCSEFIARPKDGPERWQFRTRKPTTWRWGGFHVGPGTRDGKQRVFSQHVGWEQNLGWIWVWGKRQRGDKQNLQASSMQTGDALRKTSSMERGWGLGQNQEGLVKEEGSDFVSLNIAFCRQNLGWVAASALRAVLSSPAPTTGCLQEAWKH